MSNILLCGMGRSGSTLLYNMMRSSIEGYTFYDREISILNVPKGNRCTKQPANVYSLDLIVKTTPGVKIILCIRDPRSVLTSKMRWNSQWYKQSWNETRRNGEPHKKGLIHVHRACKEALKYDPFICKYEDLVTDPEGVQSRMKDKFNLSLCGNFRDFHEHYVPRRLRAQMHGIRPVERTRIDEWKNHPERIKEQFRQCPELFDAVEFWGYEKDKTWYKETVSLAHGHYS